MSSSSDSDRDSDSSKSLEKSERVSASARLRDDSKTTATLSDREAMQTRAETAIVNPAKTSVRTILQRIERSAGYGLTPAEVCKLYQHITTLEKLLRARPVGWTVDERQYLIEHGIL